MATKKFEGRVEILFDRASDTYGLRLTPADGGEPHEVFDVHFDELGDALQVAVDDETWMQAKVTVLKAARKPKAAAAASA